MEAYRVFISLIMNLAIEDLGAELLAARGAVEKLAPVTVAWAFEAEPASPKPYWISISEEDASAARDILEPPTETS